MSILWKSYRYLKHNPDLRTQMAKQESRLTKMPVYMIPKHKVPNMEHKLQNGDIIGIASAHDGGLLLACRHYRQRQTRKVTIHARLIEPQKSHHRQHTLRLP